MSRCSWRRAGAWWQAVASGAEFRITLGRIEGTGRRGVSLAADYVFEYRNTHMALMEAKARDEALTEGVGQAKNYAAKLAIGFAYSSNGRGIYGIDMLTGVEGEMTRFPTPDELWNLTFATQNAWRDRFAAVPFPDKSGTWTIYFYQQLAVSRVLDAICDGRDRIQLTLATGTGKTSIAFQIAWKLFQARWNLPDWHSDGEPARRPRILFLADRNNLAGQAMSDFTSFLSFADDAMIRIEPDEQRD